MSVNVIKYEMLVPKESKEIVDLVDSILEKVLKKDWAALIGDVGKASAAVDGFDKVKEELSSEYRDELAGYLVHKMMGRLLPKKDED